MTVNYVLTADQFESLAAGYGTQDALTVLRDAQLAKRKLLLTALIRRLGPSPATDLLFRVERESPASAAEVLRHPHLDAWATQALHAPGDTGYLAQVAAAAAVRAGLTFEIEATATHGQVYLPGLGAAAVDTDRTTVRSAASGEVSIGPVSVRGAGWAPVREVSLEPAFALAIEDLEPYRDTYQWRPAPRLDDGAAQRFTTRLRDAWRIIVARHPEHAAAMRILLRVVVPLVAPASGANVSAAARQASGSVAVVIPATAEELSLLLLHEFMHMKLDALRDLVDLHDPEPTGRFLAPWRMDPRPVDALMQGIYAHAGVTDYWRRRRLEPGAPPVAETEFAYWRQQNLLAIEALARSGELTPAGERFVAGLRQTLDSWQCDEVPAETRRLVEAMVSAQTVRWRLRNWRPDDTEVDGVLRAWRSGRRPDRVGPTGVLRVDAEGEASGIPGIVGVIRNAIVGKPARDEADRAYLAGDHGLATRLYAERLHTDDDAWVGFALAAGDGESLLRRRPDLVREILRALAARGERADATAVVRWLDAVSPFGSYIPSSVEFGPSSM